MVNVFHPDNECGYGVASSNIDACSSLAAEEDGLYHKLNESSGLSLLRMDFKSKKVFLNGSTGKRKLDDYELYLCDREISFKKIDYDRGSQELVLETPVKVKEAKTPSGQETVIRSFSRLNIAVDFTKQHSVETDGDYHVALQADDGQEIVRMSNEPMVQMAAGLKNAQPKYGPV
ncbi:hypothetical protein L6452_43646 [Arctium lappa]|uniref:Uncharacterized protein n=1 Tax=Arctium lappa TaxID=4217 RepID=A0ACB8XDI2_ARCLA|nr:hypothetical protein L6452_43646 [Arctium lappa]